MKSTTKRSIFAATLALALPFGLAACGGDEKPSKEEVREGMENLVGDQISGMGISDDLLDQYYNCIVDGIYDDVEDETLRNIADSKDEVVASDQTAITNEVMNCATSLAP